MIDIRTFSPGDWITAGALAGVVLALLASVVLRRRAARQNALLEHIGRRLDPTNSHDAARLDLTAVFRTSGSLDPVDALQPQDQLRWDYDMRDRALGNGRYEP